MEEDSDCRDGGPEDKRQRELEAKQRDGDDGGEEHRNGGRVDFDDVVGVLHDHGDREARQSVVEDHDERDELVAVEEPLRKQQKPNPSDTTARSLPFRLYGCSGSTKSTFGGPYSFNPFKSPDKPSKP